MGSKLESVRERVREANETHREAMEMGQRDMEDISNVKSILDSMPSDVDDDIVEAIHDVHDSSISEATSDMESSVRGTLDSGSDIVRMRPWNRSMRRRRNSPISWQRSRADRRCAFFVKAFWQIVPL